MTNNIEIVLNANKSKLILDKLSICSAVGSVMDVNLSFHFIFLLLAQS